MSLRNQKWFCFFTRKYVAIITMIVLLSVPFVVTYVQYRYMRAAITKLLEYQDDYRSFSITLKRAIRNKAKSEDLESETKKKSELEPVSFIIPDKREIFSSDCDEPIFRVVNRDKRKLRQTALKYAREHALEKDLLQTLKVQSLFFVIKKTKQKTKKRKRKKRKAISAVQGIPLQLAHLILDEEKDGGKKDFACQWPLDKGSYRLSSSFGPRRLKNRGWRFHCGIDLAAAPGTPVYAVAAGTVVQSGWYRGYGNCVTIAHSKKYSTRYGHMKKVSIPVGTKVQPHTLIGKVSNTGNVAGKNGFHLHFEIHSFGKPVNPLPFLR